MHSNPSALRQLGVKYDLAKSLLDLAALKEERREENRADVFRLPEELDSVIPRAESWLLADQYDESVVALESISRIGTANTATSTTIRRPKTFD